MAIKLLGGAAVIGKEIAKNKLNIKRLKRIVKKLKKKHKKNKSPNQKPATAATKTQKAKNKSASQTAARKKNIADKTKGFKTGLTKTMGAGILGGLFGGLMKGADKSQDATDAAVDNASPQPQQTVTEKAPGDDPFIDISAAATGFVAALHAALSIEREPNEERAISASNIVVVEDIELDEEGGYPFIESGTLIPARIAEIGTLFSITDRLNGRMDDLYKRVFILDSTLKHLAKQLGVAINANAATKRANERRRDEEDVESGRFSKTKAAIIGASALVALSAYNKISALAMRGLKIATLGAISLFADDVAAMLTDDVQEPEVDEEAEAIIEQQMDDLDAADDERFLNEDIAEEDDLTPIDTVIDAYEKYFEEGVTGYVSNAALVATGAAMLGVPGAHLIAAGLTATAVGLGLGNIIQDNTELGVITGYRSRDESIENSISTEELHSKYSQEIQSTRRRSRGPAGLKENVYAEEPVNRVALLGELLGEGFFNVPEDNTDILSAFNDVEDMIEYQNLSKEYEKQYGRDLDEALMAVVGEKGLTSIHKNIFKNAVRERQNTDPLIIPNTEIYQNVEPLVPISTEIAGIPIEQFLTTDIDNSNKLETLVDHSVESQMSTIMPIVMKQVQKAQRDSFPAGTTPPIRYESATPTFRSIDPFLSRSAVT